MEVCEATSEEVVWHQNNPVDNPSLKECKVKGLYHIEDLKSMCDFLDLKFNDFYKLKGLKVDMILDHKIEKLKRYYLVKWKNLSIKCMSWEDGKHLQKYKHLVSYYDSLYHIPFRLNRDMTMHFMRDLTNRHPRDFSTLIKLCALVYGMSEEDIMKMGLTFTELRKKAEKLLQMAPVKLNRIQQRLLPILKYAEKRKGVLLKLKEWEIEINKKITPYIKVENHVDLEGPPIGFTFIQDNQSNSVDISDNPVIFCSCDDCFSNQDKCCPPNFEGHFAYDKLRHLLLPRGYPIYECNKLCKCDENCSNRVVQHGQKVKTAVFRTSNGRGWGLKTLEEIPKNTFVLEYLGEIISNEEAEERGQTYDYIGKSYLFDLGYEEKLYTIDGAFYGNASHFINHSCDPNLHVFTVWINLQDSYLPRLAIFSKRKISRGEELTFDYKMVDSVEKGGKLIDGEERVLCMCGAKNCRKYLIAG